MCGGAAQATQPSRVVAIVGAPRSGTSHLYNLLAAHGEFAYFTTVSCWAWPTRNLDDPRRTLFTALGKGVFEVDNKKTRLLPGLVMPYEGEDVYARAIPTYAHLGGHRYKLRVPDRGDPTVLTRAIAAHLTWFHAPQFLTKSPFNSFRIRPLEQLWGPTTRYIHLVRDQESTADSMRRNHFEFDLDDASLTGEQAWQAFTNAVARDAPSDRVTTLRYEHLRTHPAEALGSVINWLGKHDP